MRTRLVLCTVIGSCFLLSYSWANKNQPVTTYQETADTLQQAAFTILENNCNECHLKKKPAYVFSIDNMDLFAASINTQVFIKKKMPKGKKNVLTPEDEAKLKEWVESVFAKKRG